MTPTPRDLITLSFRPHEPTVAESLYDRALEFDRMWRDAPDVPKFLYKAELLQLAYFQAMEAVNCAQVERDKDTLRDSLLLYHELRASYFECMTRYLQNFRHYRMGLLRKSKSAKRQAQIASVSLKELSRLSARPLYHRIDRKYERQKGYWSAQYALSSASL